VTAYYNENDPKLCAWLRELIRRGLIADGVVDERSIADVRPADLAGYAQCHFFAGIGGWSHALRQAGWPDERAVWTGSCPCQPFSSAGKQEGAADPRHLWPEWMRLIRECRPVVVFGEQVASAIGHGWLDAVSADLEGAAYSIGSVVLGAHSVGAPHIRQRLYFVADAQDADGWCRERSTETGTRENGERRGRSASDCATGELADAECNGGRADEPRRGPEGRTADGRPGCMADADGRGCVHQPPSVGSASFADEREQVVNHWSPCSWLPCRDGKARPVEPGVAPLAHGVPARVVRLRGYGNAIVPQLAAEVIRAYMETRGDG
jgi:DNA (cytosine-5)-methyltransferase 1